MEAWELTVDTNFTINQITNSWAADVENLDEGKYLLKGTYNSIIQPYSSIILGFLGTKNSNPEISDYSLSVVAVDEAILSSIISNGDEEIVLTDFSMYATGKVSDNVLYVSWIPDKEVSGVEYKVIACDDEEITSCITATNDLEYEYVLEDNFVNKRVYIEAYYKDEFVGKSNEFIVNNTDGVFVSELVDTDKDGISDYIEELIGTDINKSDTDEDGLNDYLEFFILETDPLMKDTDNNGVLDGDEDCDSDGLTNLEELKYLSSPVKSDSDNDKLSDYDEIYKYNTSPICEDTDNDTINDYDEVMIGNNPTDNSDANRIVEQIIDKESECLSGVNVEGLPYKVSMSLKASGYVEGSIEAENSTSYSSTYSFDTIGEIPEFTYSDGKVDEVTIEFEIDNEYIKERNIDISSINVFKYQDEVNMFIPIKTYVDEENNTVSCKSDSLGTYCLKNVDEWMDNFIDSDTGKSEEEIASFDTYAVSSNGVSSLSDYTSSPDYRTVYICFAVDTTFPKTGSLADLEKVRDNILSVAERLYSDYKNVNVSILLYDYSYSYMYTFENYNEVANFVPRIQFTSNLYDAYVEIPLNYISSKLSDYGIPIYYDNTDVKYLFVYNRPIIGMADRTNEIRTQVERQLKNEKQLHMCFVMPPISNGANQKYLSYYSDNCNGKIFEINNESIDSQLYNYISNDSCLVRKSIESSRTSSYIISTNLSTVTLKAPITKGSSVNSDDDGLSDYEELIQNCNLIRWDEDNNIILPTLSEVIMEYTANTDYIPDNLFQNPFFSNAWLTKVLPVRSNPIKEDSDYDGFSDSEEILEHNSNPLKYNKIIDIQDVDTITDDMRYGATALKEQYDDGEFFTEISVFLANNFFGSSHDYKLIYKEALLSYFKDINDYTIEEGNQFNESEYLYNVNICTQIQAVISLALKSSEPVFDSINADYNYMLTDLMNSGKVLDKNLFQYCKGKLSRQQFIEVNNQQVGKVLDNKVFRHYYANNKLGASVKVINKGMKHLDSVNTFVTYASIVETGFMALNTSLNDMFDVLIFGKVIENNIVTLIHIEYSTNSLFLRNAAKELKEEIENKSLNFFTEIKNMTNLFCHNVGDGLARVEIASCSGAGTLIIAEIALTDMAFSASEVGLNFLQCYAYAGISKVLTSELKGISSKLEINGTKYEYVTIGEYIIYGHEESTQYLCKMKNLCISRQLGEDSIANMEHWNSKLWIKIKGNDNFFETINDNIVLVRNILGRY